MDVFVGETAENHLTAERGIGHELQPLSGMGDAAYIEDYTVFVNKDGFWVSVDLVRANDPRKTAGRSRTWRARRWRRGGWCPAVSTASRRARIQALIAASDAAGSTRTSTRQIVTGPGIRPAIPRPARASAGRSAVHSPIAANERAPPSMAHTAIVRSAAKGGDALRAV